MAIATEVTSSPTRQSIAALLAEARERTLALIRPLGDELLNKVYSPLLSPLAWDLGHIANFEELWLVQTVGGRPPLHGDLGHFYDAIENPRRERGELPILRDEELQSYMGEVRERTLEVLAGVDIGPDAEDPLLREGFVYEMLVAHELQHQETMLQLLQMLDVPYRPAEADPGRFEPDRIEAPGGTVRIEGDRLYGPGVYDMKGGAWLALQAFKQVAAAGTAKRPMVFLFTPDEEIGSPTSRKLIEERASARHHEFMPSSLVGSQFDTLEVPGPDENAISEPVTLPVETIAERVVKAVPHLKSFRRKQ